MLIHAVVHSFLDNIRLLPFLFLTYLVMEYIEHKTSDKAEEMISKSGRFGPVIGGILGVIPQCGFSAAASNLYAGRILTSGTLFAVFLSTSDEMLPILIAEQIPAKTIVKILAAKVLIGILAGFVMDLVIRKRRGEKTEGLRIEHMCDHENCHCGESRILSSSVSHTLQIFLFIWIVSLLLHLGIEYVGEDALGNFASSNRFLAPFLAGFVGLVPNCASSVVITQLYVSGMLGAGAMMAGLLAGSGVGLLVLFRVNDNLQENIKITALLYGIGVLAGVLIEMLGITF